MDLAQPLQPRPDYLDQQRRMLQMELAMMARDKVGGEEWARKLQQLQRIEALIGINGGR